MSNMLHIFTHATQPIRTMAKTAIFFLKVFPMLPSRPVDWVTKPPLIEKVRYPTRFGQTEGDLYRPRGCGPYPGIVVCLGVVPFGVDHPQVPRLGKALARAGFVALLYWSPAMRDFQLDPQDIENIALAYRWFSEQPFVDPGRSGLLGTCVGGSFALMAAASPLIRDRVAFIGAYAPYSSMWTFARDIASATRSYGDGREPWQVDPLTRKVFVHSLTTLLEPGEAERLRSAFANEGGHLDGSMLSADGRAVSALLTVPDEDAAETALHRLPTAMQERLAALSPMNYLKDIHAPLIILLHDRSDQVIPRWRVEASGLCSRRTYRGALHRDAVPASRSGQREAATVSPCSGARQVLSRRVPTVPTGGGFVMARVLDEKPSLLNSNPFQCRAVLRMEFTIMEAKTRQHRFIIIILALFASSGFVLEAYEQGWNWTGFLTKTLWDWLQLLGVLGIPVMVGVGVAWFSYRQNLNASQIAEDQQREEALQAYLDNISELLLKEHLGDLARKSRLTAEHEEARHIARARTLVVLPRLDRERKRSLLLFLYEAHLINLFDWNSADLTEAALHEAIFIGANLSRAKLNGADLTGTELSGANLSNADLGRANLAGADLQRADLSGTQLDGARFNGANLSDANLSGADLSDASLSKAMLWGTKSRLQQQRQMVDEHLKRGGRMWKLVLYWRVNVTSVLDQFLGMSTLTIMFKNGTNLRGANLSRANLRGADLSDANLERAYLREADLTQTNLTRANLKGANLTDAKMSRAKRTVVVIPLNTEVKMGTEHPEWADLAKGSSDSLPGGGVLSTREAKNLLEKSSGNKARLIAVHFKPFSLKVVKLEAETTNLQGANLTDIDLTGIDLSGVNLYKAMVTSEQLGKAQSLKGTILPNGTKHSW